MPLDSGLVTLFFATAAAPSILGFDVTQVAAVSAIIVAIVTGAFLIAQVVLNKRLRTPADTQTELTNVFNILNGTIQDNRADKESNEKTISTLREYAEKLEKDSRDDQELIRNLYDQIHELERRNNEKDERIKKLEGELLKYATAITNNPSLLISDVEDAQDAPQLREDY